MSKTEPSYRDAITEIERILSLIDEGRLEVDELTAKVKRVTFLLEFCRKKLRSAESEIEKIVSGLEQGKEKKAGRDEENEQAGEEN